MTEEILQKKATQSYWMSTDRKTMDFNYFFDLVKNFILLAPDSYPLPDWKNIDNSTSKPIDWIQYFEFVYTHIQNFYRESYEKDNVKEYEKLLLYPIETDIMKKTVIYDEAIQFEKDVKYIVSGKRCLRRIMGLEKIDEGWIIKKDMKLLLKTVKYKFSPEHELVIPKITIKNNIGLIVYSFFRLMKKASPIPRVIFSDTSNGTARILRDNLILWVKELCIKSRLIK